MQGLLYGIVYGSDDKPHEQKKIQKDDYETLGCPEEQMINQIHRKIKCLNEFKQYIANANKNTVYFRYILNTTIHEREYGSPVVYTILESPFFGKLYSYKTQDTDEFFKTLVFMEL